MAKFMEGMTAEIPQRILLFLQLSPAEITLLSQRHPNSALTGDSFPEMKDVQFDYQHASMDNWIVKFDHSEELGKYGLKFVEG